MGGHYLPPSAHPLVTRLSFCGPNVIPHFFCDLVPLLNLACSSTYVNDLVLILVAGTLLIGPLSHHMSYFYIALAILGIDSQRVSKGLFSLPHTSLCSLCFTPQLLGSIYALHHPLQSGKDRVFSQ